MLVYERQFGFYPRALSLEAGPVKIRCLPGWEDEVQAVLSESQVADGWIYAPPQLTGDFVTREVRKKPFPSRVFGLPKTHVIEYTTGTSPEHLDFLVWALSFFVGMRLTITEAGFLDATPIKPGELVDFVPVGRALCRAMELAEQFWMQNCEEPRNPQRLEAAVHALFLSRNPRGLEFETFIYLYTAIDACYALARSLRNAKEDHSHAARIEWLCDEFGISKPDWAQAAVGKGSEVSRIRNNALHEALFMDAPFGFVMRNDHGSLTLQMSALVCRLLVALVGGRGDYLGSSIDSRQRQGLKLA